MMSRRINGYGAALALVLLIILAAGPASAEIPGLTGTTFNLTAKDGYISAPNGAQLYTWGYGQQGGMMQYPGPTLIVNQGDTVTVNLINELPDRAGNVSMVFPGHQVAASGGVAGDMTQEAPPDGTTEVTYTFTAAHPGTYVYFSGTWTDLQIEMGLSGTLIVRSGTAGQAYNHADTAYDYEYLFFLTEMDPYIHQLVEAGQMDQVDTTCYFPTYWFLNGRSAPDTMAMDGVPWLPHQPYSSRPRMHPGDNILLRFVGGGRWLHPFHHHGNNSRVIALDGRLTSSAAGAGPDLGWSDFTHTVVPGSTMDAIYNWTGAKLGWDMYGHTPDDPLAPGEDPEDHGKPFPVTLPHENEMAFGGLYSGSPYLGNAESLPPGEGGLNPYAGYAFMWHSHNEKEMLTNDLFPGGMMTNLIVQPPGTPIN